MKYFEINHKEDDHQTTELMLKSIPLFHKCYSVFHNPQALQNAAMAGAILDSLTKKYD